MKLEFERDTVSKELAEELGFEGFLQHFDTDLPLIPNLILRPMKEAAGKGHFARLAELEAQMEKRDADLGDIIARCGKLPSLDAILPFFKNGDLEQFHLFTLGDFVSEELTLKDVENGFRFDSDSDVCANIRSVLTTHMSKGFANLRFSEDEKALQTEINALENELKIRFSEYEKKIFEQTGLKMIWPYPREINRDSESALKAETCPLVIVTPNDGMLTVGYALDPEVQQVVREKEKRSDEISTRMDRKMNRISAELRPFFDSFETYYVGRKDRVYAYAILWAKKTHSLCFPEFRAETGCELKNAALPCLRETRGEKYIPLTLDLERGSNVLFGANMTGKTTVLKTIYFHLTLIRMGLPIPAESAGLRFPEQVEIQLRSSGSVRSNLSGFGEEIQFFTKPIFFPQSARVSAYVLVDELFQSTDPVSGAELSKIFLESFSGKDLVFFCTSHYPEVLFVPDIALLRMKDMKFDPDSEAGIAELMNTIPYELEQIPPDGIEDALGQSGRPLQIALHFSLPMDVMEKIRTKMDHFDY